MVARDEVKDYLFRQSLEELDPEVAELIRHETARQARYLIMIPSESTVPQAVRDALGSAFHNIYAEGYPLESSRTLSEADILDYNTRLPEYRRIADERYYKGTEYADIVEALARRRAAEVFAANGLSPDDLYVNVQPLSGAPANSAVYTALLKVGDTVMGMDLIEGGHLTHGSPVNRSGKFFNIISYGSTPSGQLDYDQMRALAQEHKPKMIIGGYSSYPFAPDWNIYREIADEVGAYLLADVAHVAGLIAAEVYPNPVGIADVVSFTTHKTLNGPRGAVIITHRKDLSSKIDRGVFPGEQGGPHVHAIAALATALKLAKTDQFRELQRQTVVNAARLTQKLQERGFTIPYGGTDTHLLTVDCKTIIGPDGTELSGDMAVRILDLAGIVANRQTIPGDTSALRPSGFRLGTPWITQRGFHEPEIDELGDIMADLLLSVIPFSYTSSKRPLPRAKVDFKVLQNARSRVRDLAASVGIDTDVVADGYPHFHYLPPADNKENWQKLSIRGESAKEFLHYALTANVNFLAVGEQTVTVVCSVDSDELAQGIVERAKNDEYILHLNQNSGYIAAWFRSLSDGFVLVDQGDEYARLPGPVDVVESGSTTPQNVGEAASNPHKAFFVGQHKLQGEKALPRFEWTAPENAELLKTRLHDLHQSLGAKLVEFAGYDMPVWYTSVSNEHTAVRNTAGIFDVTHMGAFDLRGPGAEGFLQVVTTNNVTDLQVGESHYTYLLDVDGIPFDDLMIYKLAAEHFLLVVNASNNDKNWAWLNAVKNREIMIDVDNPARVVEGVDQFELRDLRAARSGADQRVDIALQGPKSKDILLQLGGDETAQKQLKSLPWAGVMRATLGGFDLIISRTGYTGERVAFEIFVHPDQAPQLFKTLIDLGATPCGLASRDSTRTEAGLPLYGHELAGPLKLNPADAGFSGYVKLYKPFFVGKRAFINHEKTRDAQVVRFRLDNKGDRPPHQGDPIVDTKGRVIGIVTSCSIDSEGYQLGQAYVKSDFTRKDTALGVYSGSSRAKSVNLSEAGMGGKLPTAQPITILTRFPSKK